MSQRSPLLSRGGVAAPSRKCREATFERRRRGGAGQENYLWLERTTPSAPNKVPSGHFLDGAATPPFPRRRLRSPRFSLNSWSSGGLKLATKRQRRKGLLLNLVPICGFISPCSK